MLRGSNGLKPRYTKYDDFLDKTRKMAISYPFISPRSAFSTIRDSKENSPADFYGKPFFGPTNTEVLVQEGSHAFFHCAVHNIGNQTVGISSYLANAIVGMKRIYKSLFVKIKYLPYDIM